MPRSVCKTYILSRRQCCALIAGLVVLLLLAALAGLAMLLQAHDRHPLHWVLSRHGAGAATSTTESAAASSSSGEDACADWPDADGSGHVPQTNSSGSGNIGSGSGNIGNGRGGTLGSGDNGNGSWAFRSWAADHIRHDFRHWRDRGIELSAVEEIVVGRRYKVGRPSN